MTEGDVVGVSTLIANATTLQQVFGALSGDETARLSQLKKSYHVLAKYVHPDKLVGFDKAVQALGEGAFKSLDLMFDSAQQAIKNGTYDKPIAKATSKTSKMTVKSANDEYSVDAVPFADGDLSVVYSGTGSKGNPILMKVSKGPKCNVLLVNEIKTLQKAAAKIEKYVPTLVESFLLVDGSFRNQVNVYEKKPNLMSVTQILERFPNGVPGPDAAWICRRVIGQACVGPMIGMVHTAIVPDHVLVDTETHDPIHIGWAHAVEKYVIHVIKKYKSYYPPEVLKKQPVDVTCDIFMAGKTIIRILGGDPATNSLPASVPPELKAVIMTLVEPSIPKRINPPMKALADFTMVVRKLWGNKFRVLFP